MRHTYRDSVATIADTIHNLNELNESSIKRHQNEIKGTFLSPKKLCLLFKGLSTKCFIQEPEAPK